MKNCKISIILPVYNTSKYLKECIDSLLAQTLQEIEIIAVNDGSTDNSLEILREYQSENPNRLYVYNTENHGVSSARNFAVEKSCGEYLWFVDSDDYVEADACEKLYNKASRDNNDLVLFSRYDVDGETGERMPSKAFHYNQNFKASDKPYEFIKLSPFPWNKLIKRSLFGDLAFPEGIRFEDLPISFILFTRAKNIGVINECLYNYRKSVGFLSKFTEATLDIQRAVDFLVTTLKSDGTLALFEKEVEYIAVRHFMYRFEQLLSIPANEGYELMIKLINTLFDYLEDKFPNWKSNDYIVYNLPDRIYRLFSFYSSREALTDFAKKCKNMTMPEQEDYVLSLEEENAYPKCKSNRYDFISDKEKNKNQSATFNEEKKCPIIANSALFISSYKKGISSSLFAMLRYFADEMPDFSITVSASKKAEKYLKAVFEHYRLNNIKIIETASIEYATVLARSQYVISELPLDYYYSKAQGQTYINLLCENGIAKEVESKKRYDLGLVQKSVMLADCTVYASPEGRKSYESTFCLEGIGTKYCDTLPLQADLINDSNDIKSELGIDEGVKITAVVPQHICTPDRRGYKAFRKLMSQLVILDRELDDSNLVYVSLEEFPFKADMSIFEHIKKMPRQYALYDFLSICDVIVSDYHTLLTVLKDTDKAIARFITDEKRYIENDLLSLDENDYPVVNNASQLAEFIKNAKAQKFNINKNNCKCVIEKAGLIKVTDGDAPLVLYYLGGNLTPARVKKFIELKNSEPSKKFFLAFDEEQNSDYYCSKAAKHLKEINYLPIKFDDASYFSDKITGSVIKKGRLPLGSSKKYEEAKKCEWKKYFGEIKFDEIYLLSTGKIAQNMLFIGSASNVYYDFNWFSEDKYKTKRQFKNKVDFVIRELKGAKAVKLDQNMKNIKGAGSLNTVEDL